nr:helicase-exonuclease AddAB subunit AddA [Tuberibacillus sp. Marseille-P3662]
MTKINKPAESIWTDEQWRAISEDGQNMLVAAAAGSGKTAVLVERIINKIAREDAPEDVDRLLIVTFTNAAAAEMKTRIGQALDQALALNPGSLHLRRQLTLLNKASIMTSHSFCLSVVRKYYHQLDLDPAFRIADETEVELIREEVMEELLETYYGGEKQALFYELVDRYTNDRSDAEMQAHITRLFNFSMSHPWPDRWLDELAGAYQIDETTTPEDLPWIPPLKNDIRRKLDGMIAMIDQAEMIADQPGGPTPYLANLSDDKLLIRQLRDSCEQHWQDMYEQFSAVSFGRLKACKGEEYDGHLIDQVKAMRDQYKKEVNKLKEEMFTRSPDEQLDDLNTMQPFINLLVELVKDFKAKYEAAKKKKAVVDFNDLEHYCLRILRGEQAEPGFEHPSDIARQYRAQFSEVLVDEYQDTNMVQETILQLVSHDEHEGGGNMFMVGDVKQSIYRFRLAEPTLFMTKYKQFKDEQTSGERIDLSRNFRSRTEVIDATNDVFKQVMDEAVGEIDYDSDAELKMGANYPQGARPGELLLIDRGEAAEDDDQQMEDYQTAELEAHRIAGEIQRLIGKTGEEPLEVYDKTIDRMRPAQYSDMTILLRAARNWAPVITDILTQKGIPAHAELSGGYFEAIEVSVMLSLLQTIDNPYQDIPLSAVLRSPMVGLTGNEMARIRVASKDTPYYTAVRQYADNHHDHLAETLSMFLTRLREWRDRARSGALADLIWQIYRETGYFDYVGGLMGGNQRQANLKALYDRARQYEATSFRGLFRFLRFVERLKDRGSDMGEARALSEQEDVVRVMTVHKSKGLEYPIVFVAGMSKPFNRMDLNQKALLHKNLGFGTKYIDPEQRLTRPTLPFVAIKYQMQQEMLAEEMRVLYVALTRAKEKLYLTATMKDAAKTVQTWERMLAEQDWLLPEHERRMAKSYLDWLGPALVRHPDVEALRQLMNDQPTLGTVLDFRSSWSVQLSAAKDVVNEDTVDDDESEILSRLQAWQPVDSASAYQDELARRLEWREAHQDASSHMAKQTVTEIKRQQEITAGIDSDDQFIRRFRDPIAERPRFLQKDRVSAAEVGTATHALMQHISLAQEPSKEGINREIQQLVKRELLTDEEAEAIDTDRVFAFFQQPIGQKLLQAKRVERELPFSLTMNASEAYATWQHPQEEPVLVQGVIDCLIVEEDGITLLDYKTDAITERFSSIEEAETLMKQKYGVQLRMYCRAIEQIWQQPVKIAGLYFFDGGHYFQM